MRCVCDFFYVSFIVPLKFALKIDYDELMERKMQLGPFSWSPLNSATEMFQLLGFPRAFIFYKGIYQPLTSINTICCERHAW